MRKQIRQNLKIAKYNQNKRKIEICRFQIPVLFFVMFALLGIATVLVGVETSLNGVRYLAIEKNINLLEAQNRELSEKLISETSLKKTAEEAVNLKFTKPTNIIYLTAGSQVVAKLP